MPEPIDAGPCTEIYFDGACPLCRTEIGHYRRQHGAEALRFVDVSDEAVGIGQNLPPGLDRTRALTRFHVLRPDGRLVSGAEAFVAVWAALPRLGWLARLAHLPGMMWMLERGYRLFLPLRPTLSRLAGKILERAR